LGRAFAFAGLAAFGFVLELFVVEEKLFAGGKNEIGPTINTLEGPILEFHLSRTSTPGPHAGPLAHPLKGVAQRLAVGATSLGSAHRPVFKDGYRFKLARRGEKLAEIAGRHGRVAAHRIINLVLFVPFSGCVSAPELALHASFRLVSGRKNDASLLL